VKFGEPVTYSWAVRHVDSEALTWRIDTGAAVHEPHWVQAPPFGLGRVHPPLK